MTGGGDFADIIRRRLFANDPSQDVLSGPPPNSSAS